MPKKFLTDTDIEELHHKGLHSLQLSDEVVLTDLAYEKAKRLNIQLTFGERADVPPAAPVRPYLTDQKPLPSKPVTASAPSGQASAQPAFSHTKRGDSGDIESRIRSAVIAKLGTQVDAKLLDNIIHRVVKATGLK